MSDEQKDAAAEAREKALEQKRAEITSINEKRTGKGTRLAAGYTRGKNPQLVVWEEFDSEKTDTLPATIVEFAELAKAADESKLVQYLMSGYNDESRDIASDPIAEYVESSWPDDVKKSFKLAVRNTSSMTGMSLEDVVKLLKPAVVKGLEARQ
jgi:hypothetical protein